MDNPFEILKSEIEVLKNMVAEIQKIVPEIYVKTNDSDQWLSFNELLAYLPQKWSKATLYTKISKGEIPYYKRGKNLVFLRSEIDAWLREGRRFSKKEIKNNINKMLGE